MVTSERTYSMLETALKLEAKGQEFYADAANKCKNPLGSAMFLKLVEDEKIHVGRIERIFKAVKQGADWSAELEQLEVDSSRLSAFFASLVEKTQSQIAAHTTDFEALDIGVEFEATAVRFYEGELARTEEGLEQRFIRRMIAEERDHLAALHELKRYLTDPEAWYKENEALVADG